MNKRKYISSKRLTFKFGFQIRGAVSSNPLLCLVVLAHETGEKGHREFLSCDLILEHEGIVSFGLPIELPKDVVDENQEVLQRGEWFVNITGATVQEKDIENYGIIRDRIFVPRWATIKTVAPEDGKAAMNAAKGASSRERRLSTTGTHTLLVLRVSVLDSSPTFDASQLAEDYFDMNNFSLVRQYNWCSFGAITFVSYDPSNPIVDVVINVHAANITSNNLWPLAMAAAASLKNVNYLTDIAEHIAIIVPPNLADSSGWYAIGSVGAWWYVECSCKVFFFRQF